MAADPIDLTDIATVEAYVPGLKSGSTTDVLIQRLISSASQYFLLRTGLQSLNSVISYDEWYDGNNNQRMFLRNYPIRTVSLLEISGATVQPSTGFNVKGYVIDSEKKSLVIRPNTSPQRYPFSTYAILSGGAFLMGLQNIHVVYTAGYDSVPFDVKDKVTQLIAVNYKRRDWIDQYQQNMTGVGTVTYQRWAVPPEVEQCIQSYRRTSFQ